MFAKVLWSNYFRLYHNKNLEENFPLKPTFPLSCWKKTPKFNLYLISITITEKKETQFDFSLFLKLVYGYQSKHLCPGKWLKAN